jgi:hypothetical protein
MQAVKEVRGKRSKGTPSMITMPDGAGILNSTKLGCFAMVHANRKTGHSKASSLNWRGEEISKVYVTGIFTAKEHHMLHHKHHLISKWSFFPFGKEENRNHDEFLRSVTMLNGV